MDEMKVYIVNLGKYVEGEDAGAWFTLPVDKDVVAERLGINSQYEERADLKILQKRVLICRRRHLLK